MKKVPGGLMVIPLFIGIAINTCFPYVLDIGGFTTELFKKGAQPLIGLLLCCMGSQICIKSSKLSVAKGGVYVISKFVVGFIIAIAVGKIWGREGVFGITPMVLMSAFSSINIGLYASLTDQFGDKDDVAAGALIALTGGAFFTMVALGTSGLADIPILSMIAVIVPVIVGFILGNLDNDMRKFLGSGQNLLIPFYAFSLGANMKFSDIIKAGFSGVVISIAVVIITGFIGYFLSGIFGPKKAVGASIGNTAGNQLATPLAIVAADSTLEPYLVLATAQIGTAIIITSILCPLLVRYLDKNNRKIEKVF
ncbi:2-keto-3-deoxygluconate permease [Clostridium cellulovorans]|nr:2-keto-3-deoxygluconate permease [Clostridium cellulovorans]